MPNRSSFIKKLLSVLLSSSLIWTSADLAQAAAVAGEAFIAPSNLPQFRLIPPSQLGWISDYYNAPVSKNASNGPLVILIQDLHANYGVQKNISDMLDFLRTRLSNTSSQLPFSLLMEGASGPVDLRLMANFPDAKVK